MMPLVTRQANQGNLFVSDEEPVTWNDGDLWSDTDDNTVFQNDGGSAVEIKRTIAELLTFG